MSKDTGVHAIAAEKTNLPTIVRESGVHTRRAGKTKVVHVHSPDKKRESSCPTTVSDDALSVEQSEGGYIMGDA